MVDSPLLDVSLSPKTALEVDSSTDIAQSLNEHTLTSTEAQHTALAPQVDAALFEHESSRTVTLLQNSASSDPAVIQTFEHSGEATTISSECLEQESTLDSETTKSDMVMGSVHATDEHGLQEKHRLLSSSYEEIYVGAKLPGEDEEEGILVGEDIEIGDKFESKHVDSHLVSVSQGKSSSFENLYIASMKESQDVEEKEVDEKETTEEVDLDKPEKGEGEDEKECMIQADLEKKGDFGSLSQIPEEAEIESKVEADSSVPPTTVSPPDQFSPPPSAPIDVTYESGLDLVGQEQQTAVTFASEEHELLGRSLSYEADHVPEPAPRHRHFSSPDEMLPRMTLDETTSPDKGT